MAHRRIQDHGSMATLGSTTSVSAAHVRLGTLLDRTSPTPPVMHDPSPGGWRMDRATVASANDARQVCGIACSCNNIPIN